MFSCKKTSTFTDEFSALTAELAKDLHEADAVVVGAGAGLSAAAGFDYGGKRFEKYFSDFREKYGITDMYSGGFYPFETPDEYWAWWSRQILCNRLHTGRLRTFSMFTPVQTGNIRQRTSRSANGQRTEKHENPDRTVAKMSRLRRADGDESANGRNICAGRGLGCGSGTVYGVSACKTRTKTAVFGTRRRVQHALDNQISVSAYDRRKRECGLRLSEPRAGGYGAGTRKAKHLHKRRHSQNA